MLLGEMESLSRRLWRRGLEALAPERCMCCDALASGVGVGALCAGCWVGVHFITRPYCERTGLPFPREMGEGSTGLVLEGEWEGLSVRRGAIAHDGEGKALMHKFKYGGRLDVGGVLAGWTVSAGEELLRRADVLVTPPPRYVSRWRGVGDAAGLLGEWVGRRAGVRYAGGLLYRRRGAPRQSTLGTRAARERNVRGLYGVREGREGDILGRRVVVLDDVSTTGCTMTSCARALMRAGALEVMGLAAGLRLTTGGELEGLKDSAITTWKKGG